MTDARQIAVVDDPLALVLALRARLNELNISHEELDELAGLQSGYSAKLLSTPPMKGIGPATLFPIAGALGYALGLVEDERRMSRSARISKRKRVKKFDEHWRNAKAAGMVKETMILKAKLGGRRRFETMTKDELRAHQSHAAKSRWKAWRRERKAKALAARAARTSRAEAQQAQAQAQHPPISADTAATTCRAPRR